MPCGKKPLVKSWSIPRSIRVITPSRYEQTEGSVKVHWKKVVQDLESSYKDDQFWVSQGDTVRELVGPTTFHKLAKIFNLPLKAEQREIEPVDTTPLPSEDFYMTRATTQAHVRPTFSMTDYEPSMEELGEEPSNEDLEEMSEETSTSERPFDRRISISQSKSRMKSRNTVTKSLSRLTAKSSMKFSVKALLKSFSSRSKIYRSIASSFAEQTTTNDDLDVHPSVKIPTYRKRSKRNPFFEMLYCNESETDMIKWKSKYKQKTFEVTASDEFSKKAEIMTKKISTEFYEWWVGLGNVEFKSEIKRPEDIEDLFQVWFDEHASRGLVIDPKIFPCTLQSIADYADVSNESCPNVLKRQIAYDIKAETSPAHTMAFNTCLPQKLKHIPPKNNTESLWQGVNIPDDLRTMACVWEEISHLTSTKAFHKWLKLRPFLPMPPYLRGLDATGDKKQLFVVPSDYVVRDRSVSSTHDLALPVSQFSLELKEVLDKLMNQ